jgi:hypothetical protein
VKSLAAGGGEVAGEAGSPMGATGGDWNCRVNEPGSLAAGGGGIRVTPPAAAGGTAGGAGSPMGAAGGDWNCRVNEPGSLAAGGGVAGAAGVWNIRVKSLAAAGGAASGAGSPPGVRSCCVDAWNIRV